MELKKALWVEVLHKQQQNKIAYLNYRSAIVRSLVVTEFVFGFS